MITLRLATTADAELIADLSRQTFYETFADQNTKEDMDKFMNEQFSRELLIKEVGAKDNIFILAFDSNIPVGYARLRDNNVPPKIPETNAIEISRIYATIPYIGKGIGKCLMEKCIAIARDRNKAAIWLGVWKENKKALRFYQQWGFQIFAEHNFILGNDVQKDWLMIKTL